MKNKKGTFVIAEIGVNHNNNMNLARKLVLEAKRCGADAVKFQTFKADTLALQNTPKVPYQNRSGSAKETHYSMLKKLELSEKNHLMLKRFCEQKKIEFMSTPYDLESAKFLLKIGVKKFKTSSADLVDHKLHEFLAKKNKEVIISTGMSTLDEIKETINIYKKYKNKKFSLLHCISNYPSSDKSLNLKNIYTLKNLFKCKVGFSDHSEGNIASIIAISFGAKIIEKHFTLNNKMSGPDHKASSTPNEFLDLVNSIRRTEIMKGSYKKNVQFEEKEMRMISRKSFVYKKNFKKNHILKEKDLNLIRPGNGLTGNKIKIILNKKLKKDVFKDNLINFNDFKK